MEKNVPFSTSCMLASFIAACVMLSSMSNLIRLLVSFNAVFAHKLSWSVDHSLPHAFGISGKSDSPPPVENPSSSE